MEKKTQVGFGPRACLPLRVTEDSWMHCVECNGRVPHHGGDIQERSAFYVCIWCGTKLSNGRKNRVQHPAKCSKKPTGGPCVCGDPCGQCHHRDWRQGLMKVYTRCRHLYCDGCDPGNGVVPQSCAKCSSDWWDEKPTKLGYGERERVGEREPTSDRLWSSPIRHNNCSTSFCL